MANQPRDTQILHQNGIDTRAGDRPNVRFERGQFAGKSERVERDIAAHTPAMEHFHQSR